MFIVGCKIKNDQIIILNKFSGLPITGFNAYPGSGYINNEEEAKTLCEKVHDFYAQAGYNFEVIKL